MFTSSAFEQWTKIASSFGAYWRTFEALNLGRADDEDQQYLLGGFDFLMDLHAVMDILDPIRLLMLKCQCLDTPVWKLHVWWPVVRRKIKRCADGVAGAMSRLEANQDKLHAGGVFQGVTLLEGWIISKDGGEGSKCYTWKTRTRAAIKSDHQRLAKDLLLAFDKRVEIGTSQCAKTLSVFDVSLICGLIDGHHQGGKVKLSDTVAFDTFGDAEVQQLMEASRHLPQITGDPDLEMNPLLAHRYFLQLKETILRYVWDLKCPEWFRTPDNDPVSFNKGAVVASLAKSQKEELDVCLDMVLSDGTKHCVKVHEQSVYASFYTDPTVFKSVGREACILLDIALAKGGPESIVESFYSVVRAQQQGGGQENDSLVRRAKLSWVLPDLQRCSKLIISATKVYHEGSAQYKLGRHRPAIFRGQPKAYKVSKVVDRLAQNAGRCPFLADE